jgi:hypothetical protein
LCSVPRFAAAALGASERKFLPHLPAMQQLRMEMRARVRRAGGVAFNPFALQINRGIVLLLYYNALKG